MSHHCLQLLFEIPQELTGAGHTHFAWQSGLGNFLAVAGLVGKPHLFSS